MTKETEWEVACCGLGEELEENKQANQRSWNNVNAHSHHVYQDKWLWQVPQLEPPGAPPPVGKLDCKHVHAHRVDHAYLLVDLPREAVQGVDCLEEAQ
jgi:hypothetical protein